MSFFFFIVLFKGLKNLHLDLSFSLALLVSTGVGLVGALVSYILLRNYKSDEKEEEQQQARELYVARALQRSTKHLLRAKRAADPNTKTSIDSILEQTGAATDTSSKRANLGSSRTEFRQTERIFIYLQILTACFIAFAHGANVKKGQDVASILRKKGFNAITIGMGANGPLAELASLIEYGIDLNPKNILWFYSSNDLKDLVRELQNPILKKYLTRENFKQDLILKQKKIDKILIEFHENKIKDFKKLYKKNYIKKET